MSSTHKKPWKVGQPITRAWDYRKAVSSYPLPSVPKILLKVIADYVNDKGECFLSYDRLCHETGLSRMAVWGNRKVLTDLGVISWEDEEDKASITFKLNSKVLVAGATDPPENCSRLKAATRFKATTGKLVHQQYPRQGTRGVQTGYTSSTHRVHVGYTEGTAPIQTGYTSSTLRGKEEGYEVDFKREQSNRESKQGPYPSKSKALKEGKTPSGQNHPEALTQSEVQCPSPVPRPPSPRAVAAASGGNLEDVFAAEFDEEGTQPEAPPSAVNSQAEVLRSRAAMMGMDYKSAQDEFYEEMEGSH